jgi:hypothetical protein
MNIKLIRYEPKEELVPWKSNLPPWPLSQFTDTDYNTDITDCSTDTDTEIFFSKIFHF